MPSLQAVFQNRNTVVVTDAMAAYQQNAYALLTLWNAQAGVQEITHYTSLVPQVASETASWANGAPAGPNFTLTAGSFLWIKFADRQVVDLGLNSLGPVDLAAGANVFSYAGFPSQYSAFRLLNQLGLANARAVRMLDSESGQWAVAEVANGRLVGSDFAIPRRRGADARFGESRQQFHAAMNMNTSLILPLAEAVPRWRWARQRWRFRPLASSRKLSAGEKLTLIDVRPTALFKQGHIPNAINVPAPVVPHKQLPPSGPRRGL